MASEVFSAPGYTVIAENIISFLPWRDILSCSQVCTNLNDIISLRPTAQVALRAGLVGRSSRSLPRTREMVERMVDVERRWNHLAPKAYHTVQVNSPVMTLSDGVIVTGLDGGTGWCVRDLRGLRDSHDGDIPAQYFTSAVRLEPFSPNYGIGKTIVASRHDNLFAVLEVDSDFDPEAPSASPITETLRLHLFQLFSDQEPLEDGRYEPIPHPEASQPVIELGTITIPITEDQADERLSFRKYSLEPGYDGTLYIHGTQPFRTGSYMKEMPTCLWNWRTGKMAMDLRLTPQYAQERRQLVKTWDDRLADQCDTFTALPSGDVLAMGLMRAPPRLTLESRLPYHDYLGPRGEINGPVGNGPFGVFGLVSDKTSSPVGQPYSLSPWRDFESSAIQQRGPTCLISHRNSSERTEVTSDENRLLLVITSPTSDKEVLVMASKLQRFLSSNSQGPMGFSHWLGGMSARLAEPMMGLTCVGGLRQVNVITGDEFSVNGQALLTMSSLTPLRATNAAPLASRRVETPLRYDRPTAPSAVNLGNIRRLSDRASVANVALIADVLSVQYSGVYAGSEHLVATSGIHDTVVTIHVWSF